MDGNPTYRKESDRTYRKGSEIESGLEEDKTLARNEVMHLKGFKGLFQDNERCRCLVSRNLPCHIDRSKKGYLW